MKHSQPHTALYNLDTFLIWGKKILRNIESLIIIILSESVATLSPPYSSGLTILL